MRTALVDREIDLGAVIGEVQRTANGATVLFVGTVREVNDGRAVDGMEYTAYRGMAARELDAIVRETMERFETHDVVVEHRLGELALGDVSVAIAVAHAHRGAAYDASRYVIEQLKRRVPIWKLEHYADGTREWVGADGSRPANVPLSSGAPSGR
jgi:molybdopterin synthase catalytic subunit